ncbi:hypothetical protein MATL_G00080020 [Megalops atlanticus]|uniref:Uncharacterized protein n=1 Tax=Megalops atlanticus TaxID=7932 RepID=A0A9D3T9N4_MEGAT|nr:hypothetical protein MATL_G00080020 [Megalops atlanticus]
MVTACANRRGGGPVRMASVILPRHLSGFLPPPTLETRQQRLQNAVFQRRSVFRVETGGSFCCCVGVENEVVRLCLLTGTTHATAAVSHHLEIPASDAPFSPEYQSSLQVLPAGMCVH